MKTLDVLRCNSLKDKIKYFFHQFEVRAEFWTNFFVIGALSVPLTMLFRRAVITRSVNVPRTFPL